MTEDMNFSLRERKAAKTKIALMRAFIERLKSSRFDDISIREVCESVEVSEGTFFNYFPKKKDVVFFYKTLMSLRVCWVIQKKLQGWGPVEIINEIYNIISCDIRDRNIFYEFLMIMIAEDDKHCAFQTEISPAEKYFAFPDLSGIKEIAVFSLDDILRCQLNLAKEKQLVKEDVAVEDALVSLFSIMIGAPLCLDKDQYLRFKEHYRVQLAWFWRAVGAGGRDT